MNKAFFLDRDGTINIDHNFVHKPEEWDWCKGAIESIKWMNENNYKVIVVTNQSGISRGRYTLEDVNYLHNWVDRELEKEGAYIDEWYIAPHHPVHDREEEFPEKDRKPGLGMFKRAQEKYDIVFSQSYMAGDKISDLKPAVELGITPFFIRSRHEPHQDKNWLSKHGISIYDHIGQVLQSLHM